MYENSIAITSIDFSISAGNVAAIKINRMIIKLMLKVINANVLEWITANARRFELAAFNG